MKEKWFLLLIYAKRLPTELDFNQWYDSAVNYSIKVEKKIIAILVSIRVDYLAIHSECINQHPTLLRLTTYLQA